MTNQLAKSNYNAVDIAKFIAAFLVIAIHCNPLTSFNEIISNYFVNTISRVAVPFFFACSGFFFFKKLDFQNEKIVNSKENRRKLCKYLKRICLLYVIWSGIYLMWQIPEWYSTSWLSVHAFIDYAISFISNGSYYHMWYILYLIFATVFGYFILSFYKKRIVIVIATILYIFGMLSYSYFGFDFLPCDIFVSISNKLGAFWGAATRAFPLMIAGYYVGTAKHRPSTKSSLLLFVVSFLLLSVEYYAINTFTCNHENFSYIIFTVPCQCFLFSFILSIKSDKTSVIFFYLRNTSTIIYCLHPMIINLLNLIPGFSDSNSILRYISVATISLLLSLIIVKFSKKNVFKLLKYLY